MIFLKSAHLECIIPERNRAAFYHMVAGRDLFGLVLIRHWGRIGTKGQPKLTVRFPLQEKMMQEFDRVMKKRLYHQYELTKWSSHLHDHKLD